MGLVALGINHKSATIEIRERVAFTPEQMEHALLDACQQIGIEEIVILSTCNRTELFLLGDPDSNDNAGRAKDWLAAYHHVNGDDLARCTYEYHRDDALRHMMQVAAGLDSMVLGEPQILGQMKSAVAVAKQAGTLRGALLKTFDHIFSIAKQVRTETAIGENPVSVAYAAVDLSRHIFSDLAQTKALLIGAGETIELVARHLRESGVKRITIANRTLSRARQLAEQFGAEAVLLAEVPDALVSSDIVISSTASQLPILGKGAVESALRKRRHRPMFMVDIAVPRDIEEQVGDLDDVYLYTVDDLQDIVEDNRRSRQEEASKADEIILVGVERFRSSQRELESIGIIRAYRSQVDAVRVAELEKAQKMLARGDDPQAVLEALARSLTNKLMHTPTAQLRKAAAQGRQEVLQWSHELFDLELAEEPDDK